MISAKVLLIGTAGAEWQAKAASSFMEPLTPSNVSFTPQSAYGSYPNHQAKRIGNSIYFLQKDGTRLRKMSFNFDVDGWVASDVSLASEHMMRNGRSGVQLAYQSAPFSILWVLLDDGPFLHYPAEICGGREKEKLNQGKNPCITSKQT
jgi:hypothetical protein